MEQWWFHDLKAGLLIPTALGHHAWFAFVGAIASVTSPCGKAFVKLIEVQRGRLKQLRIPFFAARMVVHMDVHGHWDSTDLSTTTSLMQLVVASTTLNISGIDAAPHTFLLPSCASSPGYGS